MTLNETHKLANHIFRLLKLTDITFPIGRTNKGNLGIKFAANSNDFDIMLDAVPLPAKDSLTDENNIELKELLKKYWFEHEPELLYPITPSEAIPDTAPIKRKKK